MCALPPLPTSLIVWWVITNYFDKVFLLKETAQMNSWNIFLLLFYLEKWYTIAFKSLFFESLPTKSTILLSFNSSTVKVELGFFSEVLLGLSRCLMCLFLCESLWIAYQTRDEGPSVDAIMTLRAPALLESIYRKWVVLFMPTIFFLWSSIFSPGAKKPLAEKIKLAPEKKYVSKVLLTYNNRTLALLLGQQWKSEIDEVFNVTIS